VRHETLTCYNGIKGDGCGQCAACNLRANGLSQYGPIGWGDGGDEAENRAPVTGYFPVALTWACEIREARSQRFCTIRNDRPGRHQPPPGIFSVSQMRSRLRDISSAGLLARLKLLQLLPQFALQRQRFLRF
jgi:hypothetical protein